VCVCVCVCVCARARARRRRVWTLRIFFFCKINKKRKFHKDITWLMEQNSDTKWCGRLDHMVKQLITKMIQMLKSQEIRFDRSLKFTSIIIMFEVYRRTIRFKSVHSKNIYNTKSFSNSNYTKNLVTWTGNIWRTCNKILKL
jgi:hypothetical protein